jgi:tripartite-type tricarboxylate transporter receptor subunit TctC
MNSSIMKLNYDPNKSFVPVAMLGMGPSVIAVNSSFPVNTIGEFIEYSKKNPGKVNFGSAGVASFQHFALELIKLRSGADFDIVHYKGGGPALVDLAAGHIQGSIGSLIQMQSFLNAGQIKLLAVAGPKRISIIPKVPTLIESGIDVDASNWWGILAPTGTPNNVVEQIHQAINASLASADIKKRFDNEGAEVMPMTRANFRKFMVDESAKWAKVARDKRHILSVTNNETKICKICSYEKPLSELIKNRNLCKDCNNKNYRDLYKNNEEFRTKVLLKDKNKLSEKK